MISQFSLLYRGILVLSWLQYLAIIDTLKEVEIRIYDICYISVIVKGNYKFSLFSRVYYVRGPFANTKVHNALAKAALHMNGIGTDKSGEDGDTCLTDWLTDDTLCTLTADRRETEELRRQWSWMQLVTPMCGGALVLCLLCLSAWPRGPAWLQTLVGPGPSPRWQWLARHGAGLLCCSVGNQASTRPLSYAHSRRVNLGLTETRLFVSTLHVSYCWHVSGPK